MPSRFDRRRFMAGAAAASLPLPAIAQAAPVRVGLLTIKTGPLTEGGLQMEQGLTLYLKERDFKLAGRKIEFTVADTGGNPAGAKTKAQELIERDKVDLINGPLAAFELLAISEYTAERKVPVLSLAAAEDITQRKPNPYFIRASSSSAQAAHVMAHYAATELKYKRVACIADDFAYGYEQIGGFLRVFEDNGGAVVQKIFTPIVTSDYTPFIAQLKDCDAVFQGYGPNTIKFSRQYRELGMNAKLPMIGGQTAAEDSHLHIMGEDAVGMITACPYVATYDSPSNKHFVEAIRRESNNVPGFYAAGLYINGMCMDQALAKTGGDATDRDKIMAALRGASFDDSPRGPFGFDHLGNVVGHIFIARCEKVGGAYVNRILKTYPKVSQFWTYDEKWFLAQPVYSRDYPKGKLLAP